MGSHYRNSDFAANQYLKRFPGDINEARKLQGDAWLRKFS